MGCPGACVLGVPALPWSAVVCRQVVGSHWVLSSCPTVLIASHPSRCCLDLAHFIKCKLKIFVSCHLLWTKHFILGSFS